MKIAINNDWRFIEKWDDSYIGGKVPKGEKVRIPHTVKQLPLHYIDEKSYQMVSAYYKKLEIPEEAKNKRVFLYFEGAAHIATVYVDGQELMTHLGGYTAFKVEISKQIKGKKECDLLVKLDSTENGRIPPFGFVIDYLTYGGIYRPVSMFIEEKTYIEDIFVTTPQTDTVSLKINIDGKQDLKKTIRIYDRNDETVYETQSEDNEVSFKVDGVKKWSLEDPELYTCEVVLSNKASKRVHFGFRTIRYEKNAFYLNDEKVIMRGLDRHQCYPYTGYAVSDSLQKEDARILKEELSCNAVRTSHYPQSQAFIDACDELGLLVFTEIPGWQHIGDRNWQDVACQHVREMVLQYRNHPSIVLWGVRINESQDNDEFYSRTNQIAHELDPSRPTSGVRYITKSSLLEDVYAFNDFIHEGGKKIIRKKSEVSSNRKKPLLISEANGHMFPTKAFDKWADREEHALRHARVMNAALGSNEHVGVFQWCMFDYPTHKDFGSGDRVCYHGVMDAFRNPKLAAYVYAIQEEENDVLELSSPLDIGDYPGGLITNYYVFTNADSVRLYKNDAFVKEYSKSVFKSLKHGPILINDTVGELLKSEEGFEGEKEELIHDILLAMMKYGHINLPLNVKLKALKAMRKYGVTIADLTDLYGKYIGNWGGKATTWRFDALRDGKVVLSRTVCPSASLHLEVKCSSLELHEEDTYDMAATRIRVLNEFDNLCPYAQLPLSFQAEGAVELVGPELAVLEGGMSGAYVRSIGKKGKGKLHIRASGLEEVIVNFTVR